MKRNSLHQPLIALLTAVVWGSSFVPLSISAQVLDPFTLNTVRNFLAAAFLLVIALFMKRDKGAAKTPEEKKADAKTLILGGCICGACIAGATVIQQVGLKDTTAGKAAFISALYVVLVPVLGLFFRKKAGTTVWLGVLTAVIGLYFLCVTEGFSVASPDIWIMASSVLFALQIIAVDHYCEKTDSVWLAFVQFASATVFTGIFAVIFGSTPVSAVKECLLPLIYLGVIAHGGGFTLQIFAQKGANPTVISLILSLETVVATVAGALLLNESLSLRELLGCVIMLVAVILAQLPSKKKLSTERN